MRALPRRWRSLLLVAAALCSGLASAQAWSVQTVALRDLRQAEATVAQLRNLGFDAYDEFAMHAGQQYVRVRVGCFLDRAAAQASADALAGHLTAQAVPVVLTPGAKVSRCVREDIGFLKPGRFERLTRPDGLPSFRVQLAGHQAEIVFDGDDWRVVQDGAAAPTMAAVPNAAAFVSVHLGGAPWAAQELASGARALCPGTLVGSAGAAAVVERQDAVVACRFVPVPAATAEAASP